MKRMMHPIFTTAIAAAFSALCRSIRLHWPKRPTKTRSPPPSARHLQRVLHRGPSPPLPGRWLGHQRHVRPRVLPQPCNALSRNGRQACNALGHNGRRPYNAPHNSPEAAPELFHRNPRRSRSQKGPRRPDVATTPSARPVSRVQATDRQRREVRQHLFADRSGATHLPQPAQCCAHRWQSHPAASPVAPLRPCPVGADPRVRCLPVSHRR